MDTALGNVTVADVMVQVQALWSTGIVPGLIAVFAGIAIAFRLFRKVKGAAR